MKRIKKDERVRLNCLVNEIVVEAQGRVLGDLFVPNLNRDHHVKITLTVGEVRELAKITGA